MGDLLIGSDPESFRIDVNLTNNILKTLSHAKAQRHEVKYLLPRRSDHGSVEPLPYF